MLSLRYKSRRVEPRGRPPSTVRTAGHLLGEKAQHHGPSADFAVRNKSSDTSQQTACAPAKQHQQQQRQAAVDTVCAPNAAPRAAHDSVRESQHGSKSKKKKKQKRHSTGEDRGDGERGMKRMRLNSEAKTNSNQLAAQEINCEELPSSQADHCKQQQQTQQQKLQQQERQLLLVKQFSDRGAAAGVSSAVVDRLQGGRFRSLNEYLYTKKGNEAFARYQKEPQLFDIYHAGYRAQVRRWPLNPLDYVAAWLSKRPEEWIVGDFGCGEAALALRFPERKFHSFDLVAANERITACDISSVPLPDASLDVAVFCLSLMGQDWPAFLREARRVLRRSGYLIIAEVTSRIESLSKFVAAVESIGFRNTKQKDLASFFVLLVFQVDKQSKAKPKQLSSHLLQPCLYKRR